MKFKYKITGLDCPNCAAKLASIMGNINGVDSVKINFLTEKLIAEANLDEDELLEELKSAAKAFDKGIKIEK